MRGTRSARVAWTALVAGAALTLSACGGGASAESDAAESDTLTLGQTADIQGYGIELQPVYQGWFADAVWDFALECDETGTPSAQVADTWEISPDLTSATLHVRDGLTFSDGSTVDAEDIRASAELAATVNDRFSGLSYQIPDPQTITITWPAPEATLAIRLCELNVTSSELIASGNADEAPVGSGPYVLDVANTTRGSVYTLTKREDHWNSAAYPYRTLVIRILESETAGINALKTGQIDGVLASAATIDEVEASGLDHVALRGQTTRLILSDHLGQTIPALGDLRVRQAINMVFDRDAIASQLYRGHAAPAYQIFREGTAAHIDGLTDPYPFDVERARQLMAEAGYAGGFDLQIPTMAGQNHELLIPYVTEALGQIGIRVQEVPQTGPDAIANIIGGQYPVPLWQLGNYGNSRTDIVDYILPTGIWNVSHQDDPTVAALWQTVLTGTDEERAQAERDINQYVIDQAWFVPMAAIDGFYAHNPDVSVPTVSDYSALHPLLRDFQK